MVFFNELGAPTLESLAQDWFLLRPRPLISLLDKIIKGTEIQSSFLSSLKKIKIILGYPFWTLQIKHHIEKQHGVSSAYSISSLLLRSHVKLLRSFIVREKNWKHQVTPGGDAQL